MVVRLWPMFLVACASAGAGAGPGEPDPPDASLPADAPQPPEDAPELPPDAPPQNLCASTATCQTAITLGQVSGDTGNIHFTTMGHQSAWFRVRVTEDDSEVFGLSMRFGATLTSPATNDYDVFVYVNAGSDVVECTTTTGTTTTNGTVNQNHAEWGEGTISNGNDDGRTVSIEVRPIGTNCVATQPWTLDVEGNW